MYKRTNFGSIKNIHLYIFRSLNFVFSVLIFFFFDFFKGLYVPVSNSV